MEKYVFLQNCHIHHMVEVTIWKGSVKEKLTGSEKPCFWLQIRHINCPESWSSFLKM